MINQNQFLGLVSCFATNVIQPNMLAIGSYNECEQGDWGLRQWAPHLLSMLTESTGMADDMYARLMLAGNYHRLDPLLPRFVQLDDSEKMEQLVSWAFDVDLTDTIEWISKK